MVDFNLEQGDAIKNDDIELIKQQVDMLFDTDYKEVLGSPYYGTNYSEFLYNLLLSNDDIAEQINSDLMTLELFGFSFNTTVTILNGTENDIILVKIVFQRDNENYTKLIKITN